MDSRFTIDEMNKKLRFKVARLHARRRLHIKRCVISDNIEFQRQRHFMEKMARQLRALIIRQRRNHHNNLQETAPVDFIMTGFSSHGRTHQYTIPGCGSINECQCLQSGGVTTSIIHPPVTFASSSTVVNPLYTHQSITPIRLPNENNIITNENAYQPTTILHPRRRRSNIYDQRWSFGTRTSTCPYCGALMWLEEKIRNSNNTHPRFTLCCSTGQVKLPLLPASPSYIDSLLKESLFKDNIRVYNSMLSFTSMGGKIDNSINDGRGPYLFRINGVNYHRIGSLLPDYGAKPKFAQLYIYDTENEVKNRFNSMNVSWEQSTVCHNTLEGLQHMLDVVNPYVHVFRNARQKLQTIGSQNLRIRILHSRQGRQYIKPTADEIAVLIIGDGSDDTNHRDIILESINGTLQRIDETHPSYMPLQYPLLFPYGTDGWQLGIPLGRESTDEGDDVSMRQFYAFRMQFRIHEGTTLLQGGRLFQQFVVDSYAAIELNRLQYLKFNQAKLRAEVYNGLQDAITMGDVDAGAIGRRYILPSSFTGGPRNKMQHYQDAMAICRKFGPPDFFVTFTCNPNWPEIQDELSRLANQRTDDRPDIVARVFNIKLKQLMRDFKDNKFFGKVIADIHVIEFQKRGLPHAHILITLASEDKPTTAEDINNLICAELPNRENDPLAFETIARCMIHGPCGVHNPKSPCMVDGKCSKHYPKKFRTETTIDENGYVQYRRRNNTNHIVINGREISNEWVIPYNRNLCVRYDAHINVERCAQTKAIKYLYKYIHKGHDRATIVIEDNVISRGNNGMRTYRDVDEIKQYLDCRYVSSIEACWRIFKFDLQHQYPSVQKLQYHLPGEQLVLFNDSDHVEEVANRTRCHRTMLTMWFEANKEYQEANNYTFEEFPSHFVWDRKDLKWKRRKQRVNIGRLVYAHPNSGERFYLRILLTILRGAKSYENIRTVNGIVYPTYKAACLALGIIQDDNEWDITLTEASIWASGAQLRNLFCSILMFCQVIEPKCLWEQHWVELTDDLQHRCQRQAQDLNLRLDEDELKNLGLIEIEHILNKNGRSLRDFPPMPIPSSVSHHVLTNRLIREELDYDVNAEAERFEDLFRGLNFDQLNVFRSVINAHEKRDGGLFFVYGSGGTGKTYLWNTLISKFRSQSVLTLSAASSGIAALLIPAGKTAHSLFKIPLELDESSCCSISKRTDRAQLIQEASLIIWDEAPMINRFAFEAVDRTLKDICGNDQVFGGKLVVLGGDFRQILPVVLKGGRESIVAASVHRSYFWNKCQVMQLKINMRLMMLDMTDGRRKRLEEFADWILRVGEGRVPTISLFEESDPSWIEIPKEFLIKNDERSLNNLINAVYPNLATNYSDWSYLKERGILAPTNNDVNELNSIMLDILPGPIRTYLSADILCPTEQDDTVEDMNPPELLHSLNFPGLPNHRLDLKVGAPVLLLRNLNQSLGLCNGTRLVVQQLGSKVIECKVIMGAKLGESVLIPRIDLSPSITHSPFSFRRRQFPLKLAFAMTINKSQGQTLKSVGVYLPKPVFSHGQLYVAISRVTSPSGLKILIRNKNDVPENVTKNIVYKEVLSDMF